MIERPQIGLLELERYRIDVPATEPRSRHPHDSQALRVFEPALRHSSTGNHMHIDTAVWKNPDGTTTGRSTQWGSQIDAPQHFLKKGAIKIDIDKAQGPARVVDIKEELNEFSDSLAISEEVVRAWLNRANLKQFSNGKDTSWQRILLRTLSIGQAQSNVPLAWFPYFDNPRAVELLINSIERETQQIVRAIFVEPPSVDRVDQGHLAGADARGKGGAHGAFHRHGVLIGENWDLSGISDGTRGLVRIFLDPTMAGSKDYDIVAAGYFFPEEALAKIRKILIPEL